MSRRFTGFALAILAGLSSGAFGLAKPPDLPENLLIIVQPIQNLPCEFEQQAKPCYVDRQAVKECAPQTGRTVLDNLHLLLEASKELGKARKHAEAGNVGAALECVDNVRKMVPGSHVEQQCDEVIRTITTKLNLDGVLGAEECEAACCFCPCIGLFTRAVHCWASQARHFVEKLDVKDGKSVTVEGLLKAAHLAMAEGRTAKAAELVRQAHALSPERVEADPLVYKMHLLEECPKAKGGEEASEPARPLPIHPRQHRKTKPTNPEMDTNAIERVEDKVPIVLQLGICQFRLYSPPKGTNGCLMLGLTVTGQPTLMVHTRCPATGAVWHVYLGGNVPVVWKTGN
jgi:hypothetical protein